MDEIHMVDRLTPGRLCLSWDGHRRAGKYRAVAFDYQAAYPDPGKPAAISARRTRCCQHHRKTMKAFASILLPILLTLGRLHAAASAPAIETKNKSFFEFEVTSRNPFWPIGSVPTSRATGARREHDARATHMPGTPF